MSIKEILETYKTIAVVGLSSQTWRPSYSVSQYMQGAGYRIIPVNPNETEVLGEKAYASLDDVPEPLVLWTSSGVLSMCRRLSKRPFAGMQKSFGCNSALQTRPPRTVPAQQV